LVAGFGVCRASFARRPALAVPAARVLARHIVVRQTLRALALRRIADRSTLRRVVDRNAFLGLGVTVRRRLLRPCLSWQSASTPPPPPGRLVRLTLARRRGRQIFDYRHLASRRGLLGMSFTA